MHAYVFICLYVSVPSIGVTAKEILHCGGRRRGAFFSVARAFPALNLFMFGGEVSGSRSLRTSVHVGARAPERLVPRGL